MNEQFTYLNSEAFAKRINVLSELVVETYAHSTPWEARPSFSETVDRYKASVASHKAHAVIATQENIIVGMTLFGETPAYALMTDESFGPTTEYRANLLAAIHKLQSEHDIPAVVSLSQTVVDYRYQSQGIGTRLREYTLTLLSQLYPVQILVWTHITSHNKAMLKSSQKLGFSPFGLSFPSIDATYTTEPWYKILQPIDKLSK